MALSALLITLAAILIPILLIGAMGLFSGNQFNVKGKNVLITGGSQGMGRSVGRMLAERGASVIIVARTESKLKEATEYISQGSPDPSTHFSYISADLTSASECARIISESTATWGAAPDVLWCSAGSSHPTLFIDTPPEVLSSQMTGNYFSAAWSAQAAVRSWLGFNAAFTNFKATARGGAPPSVDSGKPGSPPGVAGQAASIPTRHIVFTSSFLALYAVAGYTPYSPTKCAIRSLSDSLSQELLLYHKSAAIKVHTVFPATIYTDSYEAENRIKSDLTKMLEEDDEGQTADACALSAIQGLEAGRELVPTTFLGRLVMGSVLGGSVRAGGLGGLLDGIMGLLMVFIMPWVRWWMDGQVKGWARKHGDSGKKTQ